MGNRAAGALLLLMLILAPATTSAATPVGSASMETAASHTRIVIESKAQLRFSLLVLRYPSRVVLELEEVALDGAIMKLAEQLATDHPYLRPVRVIALPPGAGGVRLEFGLKGEAEPSIRAVKPQGGHGFRLALDIVPAGGAAPPFPVPPAVKPSVAVAAPSPLPTPVARLPAPRADDPDLVLLELRLDEHLLAEALTTYRHGRETFLPLGEVAKLLNLAIRTQPDRGTAEGFVLNEARRFSLDVAQARLSLAEQTLVLDPALVRVHSDDIYVESAQLARWLPVDFQVDMSSLTLRAKAREALPMQERLERERRGAKAGVSTSREATNYPRHELPYRLLGVPSIDQTLEVGVKSGKDGRLTSGTYTAYLTGDLLGLESALFVSSTKQRPSPDLRFTLARHDPDAELLGPLQARSVMFGSGVSMPSTTHIAARTPTGKGYGFALSNRPLNQPLNFDRHTLQGDLAPGWDVELYFNDALIGFQVSRPDGRYSFDDLPLTYGANEFRLVFHGPLGQQRVERQSFPLEQSTIVAGTAHYNIVQHQDSSGGSRSLAQVDVGLSKNLAATAGLARAPAAEGSDTMGPQLYSNLGLRGYWNSYILNSDFVHSPGGGWLNESGVKTQLAGMAVAYSHTSLRDYSSELFPDSSDNLRARDKLRLDGAIPAAGFVPRLAATLEIERDQFESGRANVAVSARVSAHVRATSVSNQLTWQSAGGAESAGGVLQLSRRMGDVGVSGQLGYSLLPHAKLETIALAGDKRLSEGYRLNLALVRTMASQETLLTASLNKSLGEYGLGLTASYSSLGTAAVGMQFFMAMGREPREAEWRFGAQPRADSGMASVRVFLDSNANGTMDAGEEPIENVAVLIDGSRAPVRTDSRGIAWLDRLPTRQHVDVAIDSQTLEDPYWAPLRKGVRLVPRPGHPAELDFPVILTSEIDGTVYVLEKSGRRALGDVSLELLDMERKLVSTITSGPDGYYIIPGVAQGRYYVRVSPQQRKKAKLEDPGMREVTVSQDGKFVNGIDFLLSR